MTNNKESKLFIIITYSVLILLGGSGGHLLYVFVVVPHICDVTPIQSTKDQCKIFNTNERALLSIPFIIIGIILLFIRQKYNTTLQDSGSVKS